MPQTRARWFQFHLWSLFVIVLLAAMVVVAVVEPEMDRRSLIADIEAADGSVVGSGPLAAFWSRGATGVKLPAGSEGKIDVARLEAFPKLKTIDLGMRTFRGANSDATLRAQIVVTDVDGFIARHRSAASNAERRRR